MNKFAYLDHNVLDDMTKGDPCSVSAFLERHSLVPVFSDETLAEIRQSANHEDTFLRLLDRLNARYMVPVLDNNFVLTGQAQIKQITPSDAYCMYCENAMSAPSADFGLLGILEKFYGGRATQSFVDITSQGNDELGGLLKDIENELDGVPGVDQRIRAKFSEIMRNLPALMQEQQSDFVRKMDEMRAPLVRLVEQMTCLGELQKIHRPNVLKRIFQRLEKNLPRLDVNFEDLFHINRSPITDRENTVVEKVNAIYHALNFLGYHRDEDMSKPRGFRKSYRDMTHAGLAVFCGVLISRDQRLVMKASAAYEYVGSATLILYYPSLQTPEPRIEHM